MLRRLYFLPMFQYFNYLKGLGGSNNFVVKFQYTSTNGIFENLEITLLTQIDISRSFLIFATGEAQTNTWVLCWGEVKAVCGAVHILL